MMTTQTICCAYCNAKDKVRKHGKSKVGYQRYLCLECRRTFQVKYIYTGCVQKISSLDPA
ncbi:IS1/IS1595 family N-terminal zinc-binding domain-containing protein [Budvicia diplopodorum]|uniref:IS1/IS1595 family N-terminal zinc-binding domain-containing protein n=1 Tax=Budvicia diplopodorum TaxID=1119056 RepID=UPI00135AF6D1